MNVCIKYIILLTFDWHKPVPGPRADKLFIFNQRRGVLLRLHKIKFQDPRDLFCFRYFMFKMNFSQCFTQMKNEQFAFISVTYYCCPECSIYPNL